MDLHVDLIKGGMETYGVSENAIFMPGLRDPQYSEWIAFSGVSVDLAGKQHYLDSQLSYERACHHAIDYLMKFGYSDIQAYMILGSAPIEGRFSGVVDIPNSCATVYIPRRIFDFDVAPASGRPHQVTAGRAVPEDGELTAMAIYEYRCDADGAFEVMLPIGTAPPSVACPECAGEARRVFSTPMLARAPRALVAALDHEEKTRHEPDVVTSLPPRPGTSARRCCR